MVAKRSTTQRDRDRATIRKTKPPCGICGEPIDYTLRSPHPGSFEVDHILAIDNGGTDALDNKQASHRDCNRKKWNKVAREVVLICGPPGAGKTTLARSLSLTVFDLDDPQWDNNDKLFRTAVQQVATKPDAQAAVIRSGATVSARQAAVNLCGATRIVVLDTDPDTCIKRIGERRRTSQPIKAQIAAVQEWWRKYEPGAIALSGEVSTVRTFVTERTW